MADSSAADTVPLNQIATVLRVPLIRSEPVREGEVLKVVTPRDAPVRGYIRSAAEEVRVRARDEGIEPYVLRPHDVLFSVVAPIGTIGIVPEGHKGEWIPSPHFALIRFAEEAQDRAIALYTFFRQGEGRKIVQKLQADERLRLLPVEAFARIRVPRLTEQVREWSRQAFLREPARQEPAERPEGRRRPERERRPGQAAPAARRGRRGGGRPGGRPEGGRRPEGGGRSEGGRRPEGGRRSGPGRGPRPPRRPDDGKQAGPGRRQPDGNPRPHPPEPADRPGDRPAEEPRAGSPPPA